MAVNLDPVQPHGAHLTYLFRSIIAANNRKFIKSDTPGRILGRRLISEHPDQLKRHRIRASLALGKYLAPKQRDFMGQAMSRVTNAVDPAGGNDRTRLESTPKH